MAVQVQLRRGTAEENDEFTGAEGEITVDTTNDTIRVHDGIKQGGYRVVKGNSPIVPGTYTKITYDKDGLVTAGQQLNYNDLPTAVLNEKFVPRMTESVAGDYTKVTVNKDGQVTEGGALEAADVPTLPLNKIEDLPDILNNKAPLLKVTKLLGVSGSITLSDIIYAIDLNGSCTLFPPAVTDSTIFMQRFVQIRKNQGEYTIAVNANTYFGGVKPDLSSAGTYNVYFEYNAVLNAWSYGAIKVGA